MKNYLEDKKIEEIEFFDVPIRRRQEKFPLGLKIFLWTLFIGFMAQVCYLYATIMNAY